MKNTFFPPANVRWGSCFDSFSVKCSWNSSEKQNDGKSYKAKAKLMDTTIKRSGETSRRRRAGCGEQQRNWGRRNSIYVHWNIEKLVQLEKVKDWLRLWYSYFYKWPLGLFYYPYKCIACLYKIVKIEYCKCVKSWLTHFLIIFASFHDLPPFVLTTAIICFLQTRPCRLAEPFDSIHISYFAWQLGSIQMASGETESLYRVTHMLIMKVKERRRKQSQTEVSLQYIYIYILSYIRNSIAKEFNVNHTQTTGGDRSGS